MTLTIGNVPAAVMFAAIATVTLRTRALPAWLGILAAVAAAAALVLSFGVLSGTGALAPQGWLTIALYPSSIVWVIPASIVMIKRLQQPSVNAGAQPSPLAVVH